MLPPGSPRRLHTAAAWLPKRGHRAEEYEDAFAMTPDGAWPLRAAVADGATETAFAGAWARQLAEGYVEAGAEGFAERIPFWRQTWAEAVAARVGGLPWYAAAKAEAGAAAAFLGLTLFAEGTWHAHAVGDCGLVHVRSEAVALAWPLDAPEQFTHHPVLLGSRPGTPVADVLTCRGTWAPGDAFFLATDAVAAWLLGTDPSALRGLAPDELRARLDAARAARELRNDDLTLLLLDLDA